jgi:hypothetical protein
LLINEPPGSFGSTIIGMIRTPEGAGLRNAIVKLHVPDGPPRTATTSSFGVYAFKNVPNAPGYTLAVASKRYRFAPRQIKVRANLTAVDLVGLQ